MDFQALKKAFSTADLSPKNLNESVDNCFKTLDVRERERVINN